MTHSVFYDFADLVITTDAASAAHAYSRGIQLLITSSAGARLANKRKLRVNV